MVVVVRRTVEKLTCKLGAWISKGQNQRETYQARVANVLQFDLFQSGSYISFLFYFSKIPNDLSSPCERQKYSSLTTAVINKKSRRAYGTAVCIEVVLLIRVHFIHTEILVIHTCITEIKFALGCYSSF